MKKINVLQILINYNHPLCGYTIRSQEIVKAIKSFAKSLVITNQDDGDHRPVRNYQGVKVYRPYLAKLRWGKIPFLGYFLDQPIFNKIFIKRAFAEDRIDLLHAHTPHDISLPAIKYAKKMGIKTIYEVRGIWEETKKITGRKGGQRYQKMRTLETQTMKLADRIIAISENLKREIVARGIDESKVEIVPNGVNMADFKIIRRDEVLARRLGLADKIVIGYIGTIRKLEGLQLAIEVMAKIVESNDKIRLLIVGGGEYVPILQKLIAKYQLGEYIIMTGEVPHNIISRYYSLVDINIYPRINAKVCHLVTPLKPLEAMAMGKFVLASDVGGLKEMVIPGVSGDLFKADDTKDFARKVLYYADHSDARKKIAASGKVWVKKNRDWKKLGNLYQKIYQDLLETR